MTNGGTTVNVVFAGLGGQGVLTASDILAETAFRSGLDVKKAEVHGMSQRGGSVQSDVRFGTEVHSPMIPGGACDFLIVMEESQIEVVRGDLRAGGTLIVPADIDVAKLPSAKALNVAMLGRLSRSFEFSEESWQASLRANFPEKLHAANAVAFALGRA